MNTFSAFVRGGLVLDQAIAGHENASSAAAQPPMLETPEGARYAPRPIGVCRAASVILECVANAAEEKTSENAAAYVACANGLARPLAKGLMALLALHADNPPVQRELVAGIAVQLLRFPGLATILWASLGAALDASPQPTCGPSRSDRRAADRTASLVCALASTVLRRVLDSGCSLRPEPQAAVSQVDSATVSTCSVDPSGRDFANDDSFAWTAVDRALRTDDTTSQKRGLDLLRTLARLRQPVPSASAPDGTGPRNAASAAIEPDRTAVKMTHKGSKRDRNAKRGRQAARPRAPRSARSAFEALFEALDEFNLHLIRDAWDALPRLATPIANEPNLPINYVELAVAKAIRHPNPTVKRSCLFGVFEAGTGRGGYTSAVWNHLTDDFLCSYFMDALDDVTLYRGEVRYRLPTLS
jgi:hypothetical protein